MSAEPKVLEPQCIGTEESARIRASRALDAVMDPEIPVLAVAELGVIRFVEAEGTRVRVGLTPTYAGCPAMSTIRRDIADALMANGFDDVEVVEVLHPPWSTADVSETGRKTLEAYGIAPPARLTGMSPEYFSSTRARYFLTPRRCPRCLGLDTQCLSEFGSTPCKALYRCCSCGEPFEYFKCL